MSSWLPRIRRWLRPLLLLLLIAGLVWLHEYSGLRSSISLDSLRTRVAAQGPGGGLVFVATCVLCMLLHLPEILVVAAGGVLFLAGLIFSYSRGSVLNIIVALAACAMTPLAAGGVEPGGRVHPAPGARGRIR